MSAGTVQARRDSGAHADVVILCDAPIGKLADTSPVIALERASAPPIFSS
jgi:hypothetical protein